MYRALLLLVLALAANVAWAQVYRSVMPDGSIVYGDTATPGSREARELELPPPPGLDSPEPVATPAPARSTQAAPPAVTLDAAQAEVVKASDALDAARKALEGGHEPLAGETVGTAIPGRTRHSDAYGQRIQSLEDAVTRAQKRLDDALTRRNALR